MSTFFLRRPCGRDGISSGCGWNAPASPRAGTQRCEDRLVLPDAGSLASRVRGRGWRLAQFLTLALGALTLPGITIYADSLVSAEPGRLPSLSAEENLRDTRADEEPPSATFVAASPFLTAVQGTSDVPQPVVTELETELDRPPDAQSPQGGWWSQFRVGGYDSQRNDFLLVEPIDPDATPFELRFDLRTQLRYSGFAPSASSWTESNGTMLPVRDFSVFEINRNWFEFSGYGLDPRLKYLSIVFTSTASNSAIFLGYLRYEFDRSFNLSGGYWKVPGSQEWYDSFRYTLGSDRTMATTFFRPGFSPGVWIDGEPTDDLHYVFMISNSFNGESETAKRLGSAMAYSSSVWWEPWGKYGPGPSDIEDHRSPALQLSSGFVFTRRLNQGTSTPTNPEDTVLRLSDGTPLFAAGALGPGAQLVGTNLYLWSLGAAMKWQGWSVSSEAYLRWLQDFATNGAPATVSKLFDCGGYLQTGLFFVPRKGELFARTSAVTGHYGNGYEWSGGINWYPQETRHWRCTFDVTRIVRSPADNILTGYRAGESGVLFEAQMLVDF